MIAIKEDLIGGSRVSVSLTEQTVTRVFLVSGLAALAPAQRPVTAVTAVDGSTGFTIPNLMTPHPAAPSLLCRHIDAAPEGNDIFRVTCAYTWIEYASTPSGFLKSYRGSLKMISTPYDASNTIANLTYTPAGGQPTTQTATLRKQVLAATATWSFLQAVDPEALSTANAGMVNSAIWRGYPVRTWLCLPIVGETRDGIWFHNQYSFAYNSQTWDEYATFLDVNGQTPTGIAASLVTDGSAMSGNGWGRFIVQGSVDFNTVFPECV